MNVYDTVFRQQTSGLSGVNQNAYRPSGVGFNDGGPVRHGTRQSL